MSIYSISAHPVMLLASITLFPQKNFSRKMSGGDGGVTQLAGVGMRPGWSGLVFKKEKRVISQLLSQSRFKELNNYVKA